MSCDDIEFERILRLAVSIRKTQTATADAPKIELTSRPTLEEIKLRAYQIYLSRGAAQGFDREDWLQAERELIGDVRTTL